VSQPDGPDPIELYKRILADVKSAGVTDDRQAEALADSISVDLLKDLRPAPDANGRNGSPTSEAALEELRAIAEGLREDRDRLEWTAAQVAHLVDGRAKPSVDPDPTPPEPFSLTPPPADEASSTDRDPAKAPEEPSPNAAASSEDEPRASAGLADRSEAGEISLEALAPATEIPERLPIRRSYHRRRLRKFAGFLCVLVLIVATVLLLSTAAG
jgi:hypothetical protein